MKRRKNIRKREKNASGGRFRVQWNTFLDTFAANVTMMTRRGHITKNIDRERNSAHFLLNVSYLITQLSLLHHGILPYLIVIPILVAMSCVSVPETVSGRESLPVRLFLSSGVEIRRADVFFFSDDSLCRLDAYQRFDSPPGYLDACSSADGAIAVVVANAPCDKYEWGAVNSLPSLGRWGMDIEKEDLSAPVMTGSVHLDKRLSRIGNITLEPFLSRIKLNSIRCDFRGKPYEGASLTKVRVFVVNCSQRVIIDGFLPSAYVNEGAEVSGAPSFLSADLEDPVGRETVYPDVNLYCYPNPATTDGLGTPLTRLVIQGDLNGHTYYYPVSIPDLKRNVTVSVDVVITRTGTDDPDIPIGSLDASVTFNILPWQEKEPRSIYY